MKKIDIIRTWIRFGGLIFIMGFLEYLAIAPDEMVEWFYGKPQPEVKKVEKYLEIKYKNGIPSDTSLIIKENLKALEK